MGSAAATAERTRATRIASLRLTPSCTRTRPGPPFVRGGPRGRNSGEGETVGVIRLKASFVLVTFKMVFSSHASESKRILDPRFALPLLIAGTLFLIVGIVFMVGLVQFLLTWGSLLKNVDLVGVFLFIAPVALVTAIGWSCLPSESG